MQSSCCGCWCERNKTLPKWLSFLCRLYAHQTGRSRRGAILFKLDTFCLAVCCLHFDEKGAVGMAAEELKLILYVACLLMIFHLIAGE